MKQVFLTFFAALLATMAATAGANCFTDTAQADFQAGVASNVDLTSSPGDVLLAQSTGGGGGNLDQQNTNVTRSGESFDYAMNRWVAQTFTAGVSGPLSRVDVLMVCAFCSALGTPPPIKVSIRATSGGLPTGADLAVTQFTMTGIDGLQYWNSAIFSTPANVTAGTQYAIVVRSSGVYGTTGKNIAWSSSTTSANLGADVYAGGALLDSPNNGSSWTVPYNPPSSDAGFKTYIGGITYVFSGSLISSAKDSAPPAGSTQNWTTLSWSSSTPANTTLKFQVAASNSATGPFAFGGPDGSATSYFTTSGAATLDHFSGNRYLKYKAFLNTSSSSFTPVMNQVEVCSTNTAPASADLSITNTDGSNTAAPGGSVTYTIKASNVSGPNDDPAAVVKDTFPSTLSSCQWTCSGAAGGACGSGSGSGNINNSVSLPVGGSVTYSATCSVSSTATGTISNTATVTSSLVDPTSTNNSATDNSTVTPQADLSISNDDGTTSATPGGSVTYTIVAGNAGPSNVSGATVADAFPSSLTCSWTCTGAGGGTCPASSGSGNISGSVNLPKNGSATFSATCAISASASGTLTNTATIAAPGGTTDPVSTNNSDSDSDSLTAKSSVGVSMTDNTDFVRIGDVVSYVIEVANSAGPSNATATVTDSLPTQLSNGSWKCTASGGATCGSASGSGNSLSDSPALPSGGKVDYVYTATVVAADSSGMVSNAASVKVQGGNNAPAQNMSVSDDDTVVVFVSGFDGNSATSLTMGKVGGTGSASMSVQLGVDGGLLNKLGVAPVTVATARSANGRKLFSLQLMRAGGDVLMRSLTTIDDTVFSDVAPWQVVDLKALRLGFEWQSATTHGDDGFLRAGSAASMILMAANNSREAPASLQVATVNDVPWLVLVEP